jgi:hypothetical protein
MKLTQLQKDLIFGSLLGDGNLQTGSKGRTWRYRALQKSEHKEYLLHKYEILKPLCNANPKQDTIQDKRTVNSSLNHSEAVIYKSSVARLKEGQSSYFGIYKRDYFNTLTIPSLKFFADMFYTYDSKQQKWIKDVPLKTQTFLNPRALAYFYMDDGVLKWLGHSNAMRICTENFSLEGVKRIQKSLKNLYNIDTGLTKKTLKNGKVGFRITIPETSSHTFRDLIKPHLVECMKYKVSDGNYGHL